MMTKMTRVLAGVMAVAILALSLYSAPAYAAYAGATNDLIPIPNIIDYKRIRLADQTAATAAQDLGVATLWYVSAKIRFKVQSCTTATFEIQSADNSAFNTNVRSRAISGSVTCSRLGTLVLFGYVDDLQQYLEIVPVFTGGAATGTYDVEIDYLPIR